MSIDNVKTLFAYDTWATNLVFDAVSQLSHEEVKRDRATSHGSLFGTLVHIVGAEEVWLSRWRGEENAGLPDAADIPSLASLRERWNRVRRERDDFVSALTDGGLEESMEVTTSQGRTYRHTYRQMFEHVVNHSSYHRGQVVTLLRQIGAQPPATDLIRYYRLNP